jgi:guanosine-3',5'-bis(diphosphate) 3'-pyrophosphohydrolase
LSGRKAVEIGQKSLEKEARRLGVSLGRISSHDLASRSLPNTASAKRKICMQRWALESFSARQVLQKVAPDEVEDITRQKNRRRRP